MLQARVKTQNRRRRVEVKLTRRRRAQEKEEKEEEEEEGRSLRSFFETVDSGEANWKARPQRQWASSFAAATGVKIGGNRGRKDVEGEAEVGQLK